MDCFIMIGMIYHCDCVNGNRSMVCVSAFDMRLWVSLCNLYSRCLCGLKWTDIDTVYLMWTYMLSRLFDSLKGASILINRLWSFLMILHENPTFDYLFTFQFMRYYRHTYYAARLVCFFIIDKFDNEIPSSFLYTFVKG